MGTSITKELEIELELSDIIDAVDGLHKSDKNELVRECELINHFTVIEYVENCSDESELKEIVNACEIEVDDEQVENYINEMSFDQFREVVGNSKHSDILTNSDNISEKDANLLKVCKKYLSENQIDTIIDKHEEFALVLKAMIGIVVK